MVERQVAKNFFPRPYYYTEQEYWSINASPKPGESLTVDCNVRRIHVDHDGILDFIFQRVNDGAVVERQPKRLVPSAVEIHNDGTATGGREMARRQLKLLIFRSQP